MDALTDSGGLVALAAAGLALVALVWVLVLTVTVRRMRADQRLVLGDTSRDLVGHVAELQTAFTDLHARVEEVAGRMAERMHEVEDRLDGAIAYRSLVRYDAYNELSGHQSTSLALMDAGHNGVVLSCITHRDVARLYCKQIHAGASENELSPEEAEAVRRALAGEVGTVILDLPE